MITELIPLLKTHTISFKLEIIKEDIFVYVLPAFKNRDNSLSSFLPKIGRRRSTMT